MQLQPTRLRRVGCERQSRGESASFLVGLTVLLALCSDVAPSEFFGALSNTITATRAPSALQQLATFAAMRDTAEEENLDWGSLASFASAKSRGLKFPLRTLIPPTYAQDLAVDAHKIESRPCLTEVHERVLTPDGSSTPICSGSSSSLSRRRPHRCRRRRTTQTASDSSSVNALDNTDPFPALFNGLCSLHRDSTRSSCDITLASTSVVSSALPPQHRLWTQLHVLDVACSTGSNSFVHVTERFVEYERMFPIVYRCDLSEACPVEAELLANPQKGIDASRDWVCIRCGKRHDMVRERCLRCRSESPFAKLFFGQTIKESNCSTSLIRFLHAAHPNLTLHRVENHSDGAGRGKGCASVYVYRTSAAEIIEKLNNNVFFDIDNDTGRLIAHYVYSEQQAWLATLIHHRVEVNSWVKRPVYLPRGAVVVEVGRDFSVSHRNPEQPVLTSPNVVSVAI